VAGAYEILTKANYFWQQMGNQPRLQIQIAGFVSQSRLEDGYFTIHPADINDIAQTDMVIIPSVLGSEADAVRLNKTLTAWISTQYKNGAEIASMCKGAFLLADTVLLEGRQCSVHWSSVDEFRRMYPGVEVAGDRIITAENGIYTTG